MPRSPIKYLTVLENDHVIISIHIVEES